jgi:acid stress chaperone HdeA
MKRMSMIVMSGLASVALLSGCSSGVINQGGDTKCKDFLTAEEKDQNESVSKMLKDENGTDPSNLEISATRLAAQGYCQVLGNEDTMIKEAPHG